MVRVAAHRDDVLGPPGDAVERAPVASGGDLFIRLPRLLAGPVRGEGHDAVEDRIQPLEPREIHVGQLERADLARLDQAGKLGHRPERDLLQIRRTGHRRHCTLADFPFEALERHPGNDRVEIQGRGYRVVEARLPHLLVVVEVLLDLVHHQLVFLVGELKPGKSRGFLHHADVQAFRAALLEARPKHAGEERRGQSGAREVGEEFPACVFVPVSDIFMVPLDPASSLPGSPRGRSRALHWSGTSLGRAEGGSVASAS